jgi:hypothetical protein
MWGGTYLARVTSPIKKGSRTVQVNDVSKIQKGQWIRVTGNDPGSGECSDTRVGERVVVAVATAGPSQFAPLMNGIQGR